MSNDEKEKIAQNSSLEDRGAVLAEKLLQEDSEPGTRLSSGLFTNISV